MSKAELLTLNLIKAAISINVLWVAIGAIIHGSQTAKTNRNAHETGENNKQTTD